MNLNIIVHGDFNDATTMRAFNLAKNLPRKEYDINFIVTESDATAKDNDMNIIEIWHAETGNKNIDVFSSTFPKIRAAMKNKADIVHAFKTLPIATFPALIQKKVHKSKFVLDWDDLEGKEGLGGADSFYIEKPITLWENYITKKADMITKVSKYLIEGNPKSLLIPNGINPPDFKIKKDYGLLKEHTLDGTDNLLVFSGIMHKTCDLDLVLNSIAAIKNQDFRLLIIGDGPKRTFYENMAKGLGINNKTVFMGRIPQKEVFKYLSLCDIALMPMKDNSQNRYRCPMKLAEYMAVGLPIVSNPVGPIIYTLDGIGILTKDSVNDYSEGIERLLSDKRLSKSLGRKAKIYAFKHLDWKVLGRKLDNLYKSLF